MPNNISFLWIFLAALGFLALGILLYRRKANQKPFELGQLALNAQLSNALEDIRLSIHRLYADR